MKPGRVIFLFGTSGAGKTSTASQLQPLLSEPWLSFGLDSVFAMIPDAFKSPAGPAGDGFWYEQVSEAPLRVVIRMGRVGEQIHAGMRAALRAWAVSGNNVIFDEMPLTHEVMPLWREDLSGLNVLWVRIDASDQVLARREQSRTRPTQGLGVGHAEIALAVAWADLELDSGKHDALARAELIRARVQ